MATSFKVQAIALALLSVASAAPTSSFSNSTTTASSLSTWNPYTVQIGTPSPTPNPVVVLPSGPIIGTTTSLPSATATVNKFLGIPFATAPERFSPPQDPAAWTAPINATEWSPTCIQQFNYPLAAQQFIEGLYNTPPAAESEDCLFLNVYAPATPAPLGGRPVMFWIYGGALQFGNAGQESYDGSSFAANQDVIVISANYRVGVFGFSNSPEIPVGQQNSGFLDQRKALAWTQKNAALFGGNPEAITIFGESAGGWSVKQLLANPPVPQIYRAAIIESEGEGASGNGSASWTALLEELNCPSLVGDAALACARAAPAATIRNIVDVNALGFPAVNDNVTSSNNVAVNIDLKKWADVPLLIGTNADDGRLFAVGQGYNVTAFLDNYGAGALAPVIEATYPPANTSTEAFEEIGDILTDLGLMCPMVQVIDTLVANGYQDTWRYYYNASFPNLEPFPDAGSWHSSEIKLVFGTYDASTATAQEVALSKYMQTTWANFAKNPYAGPGWPAWGSAVNDMGDIGVDGIYGEVAINSAAVDARCAIYNPLYASIGI